MLTVTGAQVDLRLMMPDSLSVLDIAHALANINRFTGHCSRPYSVAEHSLLVADIMERELHIHDPAALLAGLLHDAHEAYTGDLHTPGKQLVGNAWFDFERRIEQPVRQALGGVVAHGIHRATIKQADLQALATERRDLLPRHHAQWDCLRGIEPISWVSLNTPERRQHDWEFWRDRFLDRFHELEFAREQLVQGCSRHEHTALPTEQDLTA
jgi:5'-deoxynucleotidase YfbR-like HD superfamily hydrolase